MVTWVTTAGSEGSQHPARGTAPGMVKHKYTCTWPGRGWVQKRRAQSEKVSNLRNPPAAKNQTEQGYFCLLVGWVLNRAKEGQAAKIFPGEAGSAKRNDHQGDRERVSTVLS